MPRPPADSNTSTDTPAFGSGTLGSWEEGHTDSKKIKTNGEALIMISLDD